MEIEWIPVAAGVIVVNHRLFVVSLKGRVFEKSLSNDNWLNQYVLSTGQLQEGRRTSHSWFVTLAGLQLTFSLLKQSDWQLSESHLSWDLFFFFKGRFLSCGSLSLSNKASLYLGLVPLQIIYGPRTGHVVIGQIIKAFYLNLRC